MSKPNLSANLGTFQIGSLMVSLNLSIVAASAELTAEELANAQVRLWRDPERGYILEARRSPTGPPIYHSIPQSEASLWEIQRPSAAMIARAFHPIEHVGN